MTVKLLVDRPIDGKEYKAGNLCDTDDSTEAGLISSKLAIADLTGGTAYVAPPVQQQFVPVTATTNLTGGIEYLVGAEIVKHPRIFRFAEFAPSIMASLVIGATYGQSGTLVTVAATAHGLPTNKNGHRIYWPGSALIPAGWYLSYAYVDANTYTFKNPTSQTVVGGTAITGTLPYITETAVCSMALPPNAIGASQGVMKLQFFRSGDTTAAAKKLRLSVGGSVIMESSLTTTPLLATTKSVYTNGGAIVGSSAASDGNATSSSAQYSPLAVDVATELGLILSATLTNSSQWVSVEAAAIEVF